jgi:hypothetical protein
MVISSFDFARCIYCAGILVLDNIVCMLHVLVFVNVARVDEPVHRIKELAIYKLGRIYQKEG